MLYLLSISLNFLNVYSVTENDIYIIYCIFSDLFHGTPPKNMLGNNSDVLWFLHPYFHFVVHALSPARNVLLMLPVSEVINT